MLFPFHRKCLRRRIKEKKNNNINDKPSNSTNLYREKRRRVSYYTSKVFKGLILFLSFNFRNCYKTYFIIFLISRSNNLIKLIIDLNPHFLLIIFKRKSYFYYEYYFYYFPFSFFICLFYYLIIFLFHLNVKN
jgi:hypothetical protein